jgi:hypothetical protein
VRAEVIGNDGHWMNVNQFIAVVSVAICHIRLDIQKGARLASIHTPQPKNLF